MTATSSTGYSGKSLAAKLGYKAGMVAHVHSAPSNYVELLGELPVGVVFDTTPNARTSLVHVFATSFDALKLWVTNIAPTLAPDAMLWVSWPKKASRVATDLSEDRVRELAFPLGLVDVKVCAVDATWSALKLVRRKALR
ncbi:DUF3052 family protein [Lysobacter sp. TY2-98]|uniref:DUF3052 family protein n=1 Tax=Lysobacter sp. TY2-98 TaxID=2290922 RepID=UPI000E20657B|nr:DUF3052 family protein [Lysobacter sp. TY2-98]AXK71220.1 DUF3052 family protein [Lysobacter sp. TY2-98]